MTWMNIKTRKYSIAASAQFSTKCKLTLGLRKLDKRRTSVFKRWCEFHQLYSSWRSKVLFFGPPFPIHLASLLRFSNRSYCKLIFNSNMGTFILSDFIIYTLSACVRSFCESVWPNTLKAQPYNVELINSDKYMIRKEPVDSAFYNLYCSSCWQSLKCNVSIGTPCMDDALCDIVEKKAKFCTVQGEKKEATLCVQQCLGSEGILCFRNES